MPTPAPTPTSDLARPLRGRASGALAALVVALALTGTAGTADPAGAAVRRPASRAVAAAAAAQARSAPALASQIPPPPPLPPLRPLRPLAAGVDQLPARSRAYDAAVRERDSISTTLARARADLSGASANLLDLTVREHVLSFRFALERTNLRRLDLDAARLRRVLRELVVQGYISQGRLGDALLLDPDGSKRIAASRRRELTSAVLQGQRRELARTVEALAAVSERHRRTGAELRTVRAGLVSTARRRDSAQSTIAASYLRLGAALQRVDETRRTAIVVGTDLPVVVLDAYVAAADRMAYLQPGCGIAWWALAGIGFAESGQGTDGGTQVRADGSLTRRIVGIPLNGAPGVAAIGDTDGGLLDGDPTVDRAVGPMQFIPSTWARWGVDADGDGVADPQSFYDAAATSAAYLCQSGPMRDDAGLQRGYLSYNASLPYVALVLGKARQYAAAVQVPGR